MSARGKHSAWGTKDEFEFYTRLGTHSENGFNPDELKAKYIEALKKRAYWPGINKTVLLHKIRQSNAQTA